METTAIDFMPLIQPILVALGTILSGFLVALAHKLKVKFGVDADEKTMARIKTALQNGVNYGRETLGVAIKDKTTVEVKNQLAARAATYALMQVGPLAEQFKFKQDYLERWAFTLLAGENQSAEYYKSMELEPPAESKGS